MQQARNATVGYGISKYFSGFDYKWHDAGEPVLNWE